MPPENVLCSKHMANADFAPIVKRNKRKYSYSLLIVHIKLCLYVLVSNVLRFPSQWRWKGAPTKTKTKGEKVQLQRQRKSGWKGATAIFFEVPATGGGQSQVRQKDLFDSIVCLERHPLPCIWSFSSRKQILFRMHFSAVRGNPSSSAAAEFRFYAKEPTAVNLNLCHSFSRFEPPVCSEIFSLSLTPLTGTCNIALLSANEEQKVKYRYWVQLTHS